MCSLSRLAIPLSLNVFQQQQQQQQKDCFCSTGPRDIRGPKVFSCTTQMLPLHITMLGNLPWCGREEASWGLVSLSHRFIFSFVFLCLQTRTYRWTQPLISHVRPLTARLALSAFIFLFLENQLPSVRDTNCASFAVTMRCLHVHNIRRCRPIEYGSF